jgi:hypothetical protein
MKLIVSSVVIRRVTETFGFEGESQLISYRNPDCTHTFRPRSELLLRG